MDMDMENKKKDIRQKRWGPCKLLIEHYAQEKVHRELMEEIACPPPPPPLNPRPLTEKDAEKEVRKYKQSSELVRKQRIRMEMETAACAPRSVADSFFDLSMPFSKSPRQFRRSRPAHFGQEELDRLWKEAEECKGPPEPKPDVLLKLVREREKMKAKNASTISDETHWLVNRKLPAKLRDFTMNDYVQN